MNDPPRQNNEIPLRMSKNYSNFTERVSDFPYKIHHEKYSEKNTKNTFGT